ncbi:MAG: ShlB/FhaC/HecB family hemolysin secretion/activation protein [Synechococcales bacterium]|nr:ShlB/FhaC/HecB family hemolysin secretion/activation protein [Synechococcales bacterium]
MCILLAHLTVELQTEYRTRAMIRHRCSASVLRWVLVGLAITPLFAQPVAAQTVRPDPEEPPSIAPLPTPTPTPPLPPILPPPEELLRPPELDEPVEPPADIPDTIFVERFEVVGSTVFSEEELAEVTAPFENRELSFAELLQARAAVTQLYVDNGYITSGAFIPPQTLEGGVVQIQVLEGTLEEINVDVDGRLVPRYVRRRLEIAASEPLNVDSLLEGLQLLQLNPIIDTISAELSEGVRPGTSILDVQVDQADTFRTDLFVNNGRSPSVGSFRRGIEISEGNLFGIGDSIRLGYANTDGSDTFDLSYTIPVNARNGTVNFSFGTTDSEVIEDPFNFLDIQSESRFYELTYRQPILQTPTREFALSLTASRRESSSEFLEDLLGEPIPFPSLGADEDGNTRVSALRFAQEWTQQGSRQVIAARSQFSIGLDAFDSTVNEVGPDSRFFAWRGQAQWVRLLAEDTLFLVRGDIQLADNSLVPLEQFGLGGQQTVRGYRQDELLTDNGVLFSSEVRIPIARFRRIDGLLQIVPFFDVGKGWNLDAPDPDPSTLASLGVGLLWQLSDRITARFDYGIPLIDTDTEGDSLQEDGFYFSVVVSPF